MSEEENEERGFRVTDRRGDSKSEPEKPSIPKPGRASPSKEEGQNAGERSHRPPENPPTIDFRTFILSMATSALMHMGLIEDPNSGKKEKNLAIAKQEVDIVEMLAEKTKGNLSKEEEAAVTQALYELRLRFVEASKAG